MKPFEDTDLLTRPAAEHAHMTIKEPSEFVDLEPTVTVSALYWNRLMALRGWARDVLDLKVEP